MDYGRHAPLERVSTGIAGLDTVLEGGLFRDGMFIVVGEPGTGKTVLGNQMAFHHASQGGRALYITLMAESHARMFAHLSTLRFFDARRISDSIYYVSAIDVVEKDGLKGLLVLIAEELRAHGCSLLVIDDLVNAESFAADGLAFKRYLFELQSVLATLKCTGLLLTGTGEHPSVAQSMVDGVIELADAPEGSRFTRLLRVSKLRGAAHLRGPHVFSIEADGLRVFPRLEALSATQPLPETSEASRVSIGIAGIDQMLHGGLLRGSATLVLGAPGTGKTIMGLHFLHAGRAVGERGLLFTFYELPKQLAAKAADLGIPIADGADATVEVLSFPPFEQNLDEIGQELLASVDRHQIRRVMLDGLTGLREAAMFSHRVSRFLAALTRMLRARGITALISAETAEGRPTGIDAGLADVAATLDNVLILQHAGTGGILQRAVSILKTRQGGHDLAVRRFQITRGGFEVLGRLEE